MKNFMKVVALLAAVFVVNGSVAVAMKPIRYGDLIKLKHVLTNKFLTSKSQNYYHTGSSQQQMVGAIDDDQATTWWIVKGPQAPNDRLNIANWGAIVNKDAVIRLEHVATGKNLHSHNNILSPISQQQEVTGFGNIGIGDDNCNWKVATVKKFDGTAELTRLEIHSRVLFMHNLTNKSLHSHNSAAATTGNMQEVTCYNQRDDNDWWVVAGWIRPRACLGVNAAKEVYCRNGVSSLIPGGLSWSRIDGQLTNVGALGVSVWGVNAAGQVLFRTGITEDAPRGTGWTEIARPASSVVFTQISVGPWLNVVYAITNSGAIYCRTGITGTNLQGTGWQLIDGTLTQISAC